MSETTHSPLNPIRVALIEVLFNLHQDLASELGLICGEALHVAGLLDELRARADGEGAPSWLAEWLAEATQHYGCLEAAIANHKDTIDGLDGGVGNLLEDLEGGAS